MVELKWSGRSPHLAAALLAAHLLLASAYSPPEAAEMTASAAYRQAVAAAADEAAATRANQLSTSGSAADSGPEMNYLERYLLLQLDDEGRATRPRPEQLHLFNIRQILETLESQIPASQLPRAYRSPKPKPPHLSLLDYNPSDLSLEWLSKKITDRKPSASLWWPSSQQQQRQAAASGGVGDGVSAAETPPPRPRLASLRPDKRHPPVPKQKGFEWPFPAASKPQQKPVYIPTIRLQLGSEPVGKSSRLKEASSDEVAMPIPGSGQGQQGSATPNSDYEWKRVENSRWNNLRGMWGKRSVDA